MTITYSIIQKSELEGALRLDAEYYQPEYLELVKKIQSVNHGFRTLKGVDCRVVSGPFGSSLKSDAYLDSGIPFIRITNLQNFFIDDNQLVYISERDNDRLKQSQLFPSDLILSKVGNTIGVVSVIPEEFKSCNISENNIGIKFNKKNRRYGNFLLVFLNSKLGFLQIIRKISGNAQPKLNIQDIYDLIFPIPTKKMLKEINNIVVEAKKKLDKSKLFYYQAENLLLEELGLSSFTKAMEGKKDLSWIVDFSEVEEANRMDADHFQPKYDKLIAKIKKQKAKILGEIVLMKKGIEPGSKEYQDEGLPFIRVSNLSKQGINDQNQKYLRENLYKKLKKNFEPKIGEVLLTKDATPGIAYVIKEPIEGIISGGILRLKITSKIAPEYLALVLNSIVGQFQAERDTGGSVIIHWRPDQIKDCLIPILSKSTQQKIARLVRQFHAARKKSKKLLEEAKRKVEGMIERSR